MMCKENRIMKYWDQDNIAKIRTQIMIGQV